MPTLEAELWSDIQDLIGKANLWPIFIRNLFWSKNIKHYSGILICAFVFVNGLNPIVFLQWCDLRGMCRDNSSRNEIVSLLNAFESNPSKYNYYAYNVHFNRYETLSGRTIRY